MKNKILLNIFVLVIFFIAPVFVFAQDKTDTNSTSAGFAKVVDAIENFRKKMVERFEAQKDIFDEKANVGEVSQNLDGDEPTTNYVIKGSSDKLIEPIFKVLAFIFSGLILIFAKSILFYLVVLFFIFILLRYLWRRAV
jgi:ABC-type multidrug transport system fused ATPase/permease subunit